MRTLAELNIGEKSEIVSISEHPLTNRLMEMNLIPGNKISLLFKAPLGDPIAVQVEGYILSLRLDEAKLITIS